MGLRASATGRPYQSFIYLLEALSRPDSGAEGLNKPGRSQARPGSTNRDRAQAPAPSRSGMI